MDSLHKTLLHKMLLIVVIIYYANMHCMDNLLKSVTLLPNFTQYYANMHCMDNLLKSVTLLPNFTQILSDATVALKKKENQISDETVVLRKKEKQFFCENLFKLIAQYIRIPKKEMDFKRCSQKCYKIFINPFGKFIISGYNVLKDVDEWPIKKKFAKIPIKEKQENISPAIFNPLPFNVICLCLNLIKEYINSEEKRVILLEEILLYEQYCCKCKKKIIKYQEKIFAFIINEENQKKISKSLIKKNYVSDIVVNPFYQHEKDNFLAIIAPNIIFLSKIMKYVEKNTTVCMEEYYELDKKIEILKKIIDCNIVNGKLSIEVINFINNKDNFLEKIFFLAFGRDNLLLKLRIIQETEKLDLNPNYNTMRKYMV